jgi:hypothetical protein
VLFGRIDFAKRTGATEAWNAGDLSASHEKGEACELASVTRARLAKPLIMILCTVHKCVLYMQEQCMNTLKSLRGMYDGAASRDPDLGEPGVELLRSPNELEFRCYYLLMFVNDREEREAQRMLAKMTPEELQSQPMRLVTDVMAALYTNNFVRFFALVRSATLLQACVLSRYFNQVSLCAL